MVCPGSNRRLILGWLGRSMWMNSGPKSNFLFFFGGGGGGGGRGGSGFFMIADSLGGSIVGVIGDFGGSIVGVIGDFSGDFYFITRET